MVQEIPSGQGGMPGEGPVAGRKTGVNHTLFGPLPGRG